MSKWLWQWKWAFVIAIFAGPAFAYYSYAKANRIEHVVADGAVYEAVVTGGSEQRGRRGARTYKLNIEWADANGAPHADELEISSDYAHQVFIDDYVDLDTVQVRYLPSETDGPLVIVPDAAHQVENNRMFQWLGIAAGILGLIISPIWFWLERRFSKKQDDDIDAELARMRAGQQRP